MTQQPAPRSPSPAAVRRVVVKVGTNLLTAGTDHLDGPSVARVCAQVAAEQRAGREVVIVTSGAIAAGRARLGARGIAAPHARDLHGRQVLAAVGQGPLFALWDEVAAAAGVTVAQTLLTRRDLADRLGYLNARNTLLALMESGVVPLVNENDVVATDEIRDARIGDNDNLSAQVANLVDADLLLILTDVDGLYTQHPGTPGAQRIAEVPAIDDRILQAAAGQPGRHGTGGMTTKVQAAKVATAFGATVVIADGHDPDALARAVRGEAVGTRFLPTGDHRESRRRFLLSGLQQQGVVVVDDGAARALTFDGTSLLPAGIVEARGRFRRGDVVRIDTQEGHHLATGRINYDQEDVQRIRGLRSDRIADALGYEYGAEVVHRNNLVLVAPVAGGGA